MLKTGQVQEDSIGIYTIFRIKDNYCTIIYDDGTTLDFIPVNWVKKDKLIKDSEC